MNRSGWYFCVVAVGCLVAVGLRAVSLRDQAPALPEQPTPITSAPLDIPGDYVAGPVVDLDETDRGPHRIISMAPSITETVCALGLENRLVGRTQYCLYPPGLEHVPEVGALLDSNLEKIRALQPELVLVTANSVDLAARLAALDLPVLPVPHDSLENIYRAIEVIGSRCARPRTARALQRLIRADVEALRVPAGNHPGGLLEVLITTGPLPAVPGALYVAGPKSFLDGLLTLSGHANAARELLSSSFDEIPLEKLLATNPDVILEFRDPQDQANLGGTLAAWSKVGRLKAVERGRVLTIGTQAALSAGPRIALTLYRMRQALNSLEQQNAGQWKDGRLPSAVIRTTAPATEEERADTTSQHQHQR